MLQNKFTQPHNGGQWPPPTPQARPNGWAEWANGNHGQLVHSPPTHSGQKVAKISILAQFGLPGCETGHMVAYNGPEWSWKAAVTVLGSP